MKNVTKLFLASILMLPLSATTSAIEVSARSGNDGSALNAAQIKFSKLEVLIEKLQEKVNGHDTCSALGKFYSPDADPDTIDANGCLIANGNSLTTGWPDVIYCSNGSSGAAHFLDYAPDASGQYVYRTPASGGRGDRGFYIDIAFNADGEVIRSYYTSCQGKTIRELYLEGKAFNIAN